MKKELLLALAILLNHFLLWGQWKSFGHDQTPSRNGLITFKVMAPTDEVVWATTFDAATFMPTPTFLRSTDGLNTVESGTITTEDPSLSALDLFAFDAQTAWAAMTSEPCQCYGQLYRTVDGGQTWSKMLVEDTEQSLVGIYFWSSTEGIAIGSDGTGQTADQLLLLRTSDGGSSWTDVTPGDIQSGEGLWLGSGNGHYEVVGDHLWIGTRAGRIWHSPDRGHSWEATLLDASRTINTVAFQTEETGLAGSAISSNGTFNSNKLWRTQDGGQSWEALPVATHTSLFSLQYVTGTPSTYAFSGGYSNPGMAVSTTGGQYWTDIPASSLVGATYRSPTLAYAGGRILSNNKGGLYRLTSSFAPEHVNVRTLAGSGTEGTTGGVATQATLYNPNGMVYDQLGQLYIANDYYNNILRLTPDGQLENLAGVPAIVPGDQDSTALEARFHETVDLAIDQAGRLVIGDRFNRKIKMLDLAAEVPTVTTLAGNGSSGTQDGPAATASFNPIASLAIDPQQNIIVGTNTNIRKISPDSIVTTLAGGDLPGDRDGQGTAAAFNLIWDMEIDSAGQIYVADIFNHKIRKITPGGAVSTLAGDGTMGRNNGPARSASFMFPEGIAVAPDGRVFVGDGANGLIRLIDTSGMVSNLAGQAHDAYANGAIGYPGPKIINGDGEWATLSRSRSLLYTPQNSLLHTEWGSDMVREIQLGIPSQPLRIDIPTSQDLHTYHLDHLEPFQFSADALNTSEYPVSDVYLRVQVFDETRLRYQATTPSVELAVLDVQTFSPEEVFTPPAAGRYRVAYDFFVEGRRVDQRFEYLEVSDTIMAYDDAHYYLIGSYGNFLEDFQDGYGLSYTLAVADTLTGIRCWAYIPGETPVQLEVWRIENGQITELLAQHSIPSIAETPGVTGLIDLPFPALHLDAGQYLFTIQAAGMISFFDNNRRQNNYLLGETGWTNTRETFGGDDIQLMLSLILGNSDISVSVREFPVALLEAKVFPNPFDDIVDIQLDKTAPVHLSLYDLHGHLIRRDFFQGQNHQWAELGDLPSGVYTLLLESAGARQAIKLLKP